MIINFNEIKEAMTSTLFCPAQEKRSVTEKKEPLSAGYCHICKKGSEHSIINTGDDNLILLTVVVER